MTGSAARALPLARRLYRFFLRSYPAADRRRAGQEMEELFEDLYNDARCRRGRIAAWWLGLRAYAEATRQGMLARYGPGKDAKSQGNTNGQRTGIRHRTGIGQQTGIGQRNAVGQEASGSGREKGDHNDDRVRNRGSGSIVDNVVQDSRYAVRTFLFNPGVTGVAIVVFALGIGANTAVFSVVEAALLRSLPFSQPERLVDLNWLPPQYFERGYRSAGGGVVPLATYRAWRQRARQFEEMAAYTSMQPVLTGLGEPEEILAYPIESRAFAILGARPLIGRGFLPEDDRAGAPRIVVLSHAFWSTRFGRDPTAIGRTVTLDGEAYEIVGIMPRGFRFPTFSEAPAHMWMPLGLALDFLDQAAARGQGGCWVVGRLREGVTPSQAMADLDLALEGLERGARFEGWRTNVTPLHSWVTGEVRQPLLLLLGAVGLVLLVACSNVANLLLARGAAREREMTIRMAVGASQRRLMGQVLVESVLLALGGGLLGVALADRSIPLILSLGESMIPRINDVGINASVLGVTLLGTFVAGIVAGCAPARRAARRARGGRLALAGRGAGEGRRLARATDVLVAAQVALTLMLLAGAGLLLRSMAGLLRVETGFETEQVLVAEAELPGWLYPQPENRLAFADEALERARNTPGIVEAALATFAPFENGIISSVSIPDTPELDSLPWATVASTTPEYFSVAGIPLLRGSLFDDTGVSGGAAAIIDQAAAEAYFPGQDPLGRRLATYRWHDDPLIVVGVVGNVREDSLREDPPPHVYVPLSASPERWLRVLARTGGEPGAAAVLLREAVRAVDPLVPIERVIPIRTLVSESLMRERFYMLLLGSFATTAILMAGAGIFGVMRYAVGRRTRELGIRVALGARRGDILALLIGRGLGLAAIGILLGVLGAAATTRLLAGFLYGLSPLDPITFVASAAVLLGLSIAATAVPAWRATRVDPVLSLQAQ